MKSTVKKSIGIQNLRLRRKTGFELGPISVTIEAGARVALLGPSGCGKTTLLRCMAGLETPDAGSIQFADRVMFDATNRTHVPPHQRRIGFVFQDAALWPHLSVWQHLRFVDPSISREAATARLTDFGLEALADRLPGQLSGGEAQRLALARALVGNPEVLLLDEPLHSVDVQLRDELALLIRRVCEEHGLTLVVVTHDRDEALAMADELVVLRSGHVVETGPVHDLLRQPKTAFTAALLCRAACLSASHAENGTVETAFGRFDGIGPDALPQEMLLVLLPGDVSISTNGDGRPVGRVLQVVPTATGSVAKIEICGQTIAVPCDETTRPGSDVALTLNGSPRLLREDGTA